MAGAFTRSMQFSYACVNFKVGSENLLQGISCISYIGLQYEPLTGICLWEILVVQCTAMWGFQIQCRSEG